MSLLDDLQKLDFSAIVQARASITVAVNGPDLKALLDGGAAGSALGGLGDAIKTLRTAYSDPSALLGPLSSALGGLAPSLGLDQLPIADLEAAAKLAQQLVGQLLALLNGDPSQLAGVVGMPIKDILEQIGGGLSGFGEVVGKSIGEFSAARVVVEGGLGGDPRALIDAVLHLASPFSGAALGGLRQALDVLLHVDLTISVDRSGGLVAALDAVAAAGNAGELAQALAYLERVRAATVSTLRDELTALTARIRALPVDSTVAALRAVGAAIETPLEFMATLRQHLATARDEVRALDPAVLTKFLPLVLDGVERFGREQIAEPVDAAVAKVVAWVQELFSHLPLRALHDKLRAAFFSAAEALAKADLGRFAREAHAKLDAVLAPLDSLDLPANVRTALQNAGTKIRAALDAVVAAVGAIKQKIDELAAQAVGLLNQGADALVSFKAQLEPLKAAVDQLGIEAAAKQISDAVQALQAQAEKLLSSQPLPEPLRPLVQQLVKQVESIDIKGLILSPVQAATETMKLGALLHDPIQRGLSALRDALANLIPAQLTAAIQGEIGAAFEVLKAFDPSTLADSVGKLVGDSAKAIQALDPTHLVEEASAPFKTLLGFIDALRPSLLLAPVLNAWDNLLSAAPLPSVDGAMARGTAALDGLGDGMRRAALEPARQLAGDAELQPMGSAADAAPDAPAIRDLVRLIGYLPAKLHAALASLESGVAGTVVAEIGRLGAGLAADLRALAGVLVGMESSLRRALDTALEPLAAAQLRADLSIQQRFLDGSVDVEVACAATWEASPVRLREALAAPLTGACAGARQLADGVLALSGSGAHDAARAIEASPLGALANLDALLGALDVEPVAAEFEALVVEALTKGADLLPGLAATLRDFTGKLLALVAEYNPGAQALKFLKVLDAVRAELDVLNPRRLASELDPIHAELRRAVAAYDPASFAAQIVEKLNGLATRLSALQPATLLGDLSFMSDLKAKIDATAQSLTLSGSGDALKQVGDKLAALDPSDLLASVDQLGDRIDAAFAGVAEQIKHDIVALLESLKYAGASASVTVSGSVGP